LAEVVGYASIGLSVLAMFHSGNSFLLCSKLFQKTNYGFLKISDCFIMESDLFHYFYASTVLVLYLNDFCITPE